MGIVGDGFGIVSDGLEIVWDCLGWFWDGLGIVILRGGAGGGGRPETGRGHPQTTLKHPKPSQTIPNNTHSRHKSLIYITQVECRSASAFASMSYTTWTFPMKRPLLLWTAKLQPQVTSKWPAAR